MAYYRRRRGRRSFRRGMRYGRRRTMRKSYRRQALGIKYIYSYGNTTTAINALKSLYTRYQNYARKIAMTCHRVQQSTGVGTFGAAGAEAVAANMLGLDNILLRPAAAGGGAAR